MNNKGAAVLVYFMLGVVFFILGMALAPALTQTTGEGRTQLDCSNSSISNQDKAVCTQLDSIPPFFVGLVFGLAGIIIGRIIS